jgi:hypothetical protein
VGKQLKFVSETGAPASSTFMESYRLDYHLYSLFSIPSSLFPLLYSLFSIPSSLFPPVYSLFSIPSSLLPLFYSLSPIPFSLLPLFYSLSPIPFSLFPLLYSLFSFHSYLEHMNEMELNATMTAYCTDCDFNSYA